MDIKIYFRNQTQLIAAWGILLDETRFGTQRLSNIKHPHDWLKKTSNIYLRSSSTIQISYLRNMLNRASDVTIDDWHSNTEQEILEVAAGDSSQNNAHANCQLFSSNAAPQKSRICRSATLRVGYPGGFSIHRLQLCQPLGNLHFTSKKNNLPRTWVGSMVAEFGIVTYLEKNYVLYI